MRRQLELRYRDGLKEIKVFTEKSCDDLPPMRTKIIRTDAISAACGMSVLGPPLSLLVPITIRILNR